MRYNYFLYEVFVHLAISLSAEQQKDNSLIPSTDEQTPEEMAVVCVCPITSRHQQTIFENLLLLC